MSRFNDFYRLYLMVRKSGRSCRESYELAEKAYKKKHGKRAYASYHSFATMQSRKFR